MDSLVVFVVVNYNGAAVLGPCVDSILAQRHRNLRLLVVDNHSSDRSAQEIVERHPEAEVLFLNENSGYARANNIGIEAALRLHPEYIALVNNDVELREEWLDSLMGFAEDGGYDSVQSAIVAYGSQGVVDSLGIGISRNLHVYDRGHGEVLDEKGADRPLFGPCVAAALFRSDAVKDLPRAGGFLDESLISFYEDVEWCFRANLQGLRAGLLYRPLCSHRRSFTADRIRPTKSYLIGRNYFLVIGAYLPLSTLAAKAFPILSRRGLLWARTLRHPLSFLAFLWGSLVGIASLPGRRLSTRRFLRERRTALSALLQRIREGQYV